MSKRILITGAGSYIGTSLEKWLAERPCESGEYEVDTVDMQGEAWRERSFAGYDTVFHVAGIAHADTGRASEETKALYYKVNRDLTIETAEKAKADGARQFVFMSSIIVYGGKNTVITKDTAPNPDNFYGDSKLQADTALEKLGDGNFKIAILRPPMVYGKGSKGNFPRLAKLAAKTPIFPNYPNRRSMIYIDNLCRFIKQTIDIEAHGIFMPQNKEYVSTTELVKTIAAAHGKKMRVTKMLNPAISLLKNSMVAMSKLFGDLVYEHTGDEGSYNVVAFEESIRRSVGI